ncbi:MAG: ROK family protein [Candidatus Bipolaricaulota bacterium]
MNESVVISLDVGGTNVTSGIISSTGRIMDLTFLERRIDSSGTKDKVLEKLAEIINFQLEKIEPLELSGVGIGMPGPFDYRDGVSYMEKKFSSLKGVNLGAELRKLTGVTDHVTIKFVPDSWAFLLGEVWVGAARNCGRAVGITVGTGLGSGFIREGRPVEKAPGVPPCAWIGNLPYGDGKVEDYVSKEGIKRRYRELSDNSDAPEVREIARKAYLQTDRAAIEVFQETGEILAEVLIPVLEDFDTDCIVFGGKISLAFPLFSAPLRSSIEAFGSVKLKLAERLDESPLFGAAKAVFLGEKYRPPVLRRCEVPPPAEWGR